MIKKIKMAQTLLFTLMLIGVLGSGHFIFFELNKLAASLLIVVTLISAYLYGITEKIGEKDDN